MSFDLPDPFIELPPGAVDDRLLRDTFEAIQRNLAALATQLELRVSGVGGRSLAFGLSVVTWAGAAAGATLAGVSHGLQTAPSLVACFDTGGANWIAAPESGLITATTFDIFIRTADGGAGGAGNTQRIGWMAVA